jgi:N-acetylglucosaminyldiphosphoundecaprenol N-acetyl-beta-D-mannosaminyltransferase
LGIASPTDDLGNRSGPAGAPVKRTTILGVAVDPLTRGELQSLVRDTVAGQKNRVIANHNTHSIYLYHHDPIMRAFYAQADLVHVDGMPIILLGKLLGYAWHREQRVTYVDWLPVLMADASRAGWRVFYLGSRPGVVERGATILRDRFPSLQIGVHDGYFDMASRGSNAQILETIRRFRPDILMVGMGMPRQEHWILANKAKLDVKAILTAGACMDYVAGAIPTPPRWMGSLGLEWAFRLGSDPSRLWKRYLLEPWYVLMLVLRDMWWREEGRNKAQPYRSPRGTQKGGR